MRSYDLSELEELSALSRRTISDYVSRGLLAGPSHRGRGARYSQRDLDALRVIPRLRTVMKPEFPTLVSVRDFLTELSPSELRQLVRLSNERAFEVEVRRIRLLLRLKTFLPAVSPERVSAVLSELTPEQICGVDRGQIQIGSLLNMEALASDERAINGNGSNGNGHYANGNGSNGNGSNGNGHYANGNGSNGNGNGNGHYTEVDDETDSRYERFGNSTVQVRIDKQALVNQGANASLSDTMRDFAKQIETLLKASG